MSTLYSKEKIISLLTSKESLEILNKYPLTSLLAFGSVTTDEFIEESDVDLALIGATHIKLDNILDLELFFEHLLNRKIENFIYFRKLDVLGISH